MRGIKWAKRRRSREFETTQAASDADAGGAAWHFLLRRKRKRERTKQPGQIMR